MSRQWLMIQAFEGKDVTLINDLKLAALDSQFLLKSSE